MIGSILCSGCTQEYNLHHPIILDEATDFFNKHGVSDFTLDTCRLWGWRCRAKLAVRGSSTDPLIGLYQEGTHNVVDIPDCKDFKQSKDLKKTDGTNRQRITGITKLEDANDARGKSSDKCTLILREGDSVKALAMAGISVVGRNYYGVFLLRGLDVVRTDRTLVFYVKQEKLSKLWDILAVYAWFDIDVGYCQGFHFLSKSFLKEVPSVSCYVVCFVNKNGNGSEEMGIPYDDVSGGATTTAVTVTTMKQELCNGREGENRVLWGFPWQIGGDGNVVGDLVDSGRESWNGRN
ncbi:DNA topoisomerase 2 [Camellia lanceoleosa]|uniref:DNA topoisomerase 2 n=1 Tax=Camellia lanceoleosa TaxID=1840588 RepID=A0ACC0G710_9ERIC|nr:DNA topoisomerase 2 [Camellia lanceoleosa]